MVRLHIHLLGYNYNPDTGLLILIVDIIGWLIEDDGVMHIIPSITQRKQNLQLIVKAMLKESSFPVWAKWSSSNDSGL